MGTYTVQVEAYGDDIWQALAPAETMDADSAMDAAHWTATNQDLADGDNWRVCVWFGADTSTEAAHLEYASDESVHMVRTSDEEGVETMTTTRLGDEVRQVFTIDGVVVVDDVAHSGTDFAAEWMQRNLVDHVADGWSHAPIGS